MMSLPMSFILLITVTAIVRVEAQQIIFPGRARPSTTQEIHHGVVSTCYPQDSCRSRGNSRLVLSTDNRSCQCDDLCQEHGDCCMDAVKYDIESAVNARLQWKCTELRNYYGIFLKVACPAHWLDQTTRELCESESTEDDPMRKLPVTSLMSQLTYKNYYCALCNDDMLSPVYWVPHLECGDRPLNFSFGSTGFWNTIEYVSQKKSWGFYVRNGSFVSCTVDAQMPQTVVDFVRRCVPFVDDCHSNWTDHETRERCHSYTSYMFESDEAFRNQDCGICNYAKTLSCMKIGPRFAGGKFNSHIFTMLFDVNERQGSIVGSVRRCVDTEVYDPFARRCRSVFCGQKDYSFRDGRCMPIEDIVTTATTPIDVDVVVFPVDDEVWFDDGTNEMTTSFTYVDVLPVETNASDRNDVVLSFDGDSIAVNRNFYCEKFVYNRSDFVVFDNGSIYLKVYKRQLLPKDFYLVNDKVHICVKTLLGDDFNNYSNKFSPYLSVVTTIGLGISLLCLLAHLICFLLVPDLRNLSGKNLASLCVALFIGYSMFITAQISTVPTTVCSTVGILMYFAFLSSFFWMNTMAFDVWRALRQAVTELRVSSGQQWRKFIAYSAYSWLSPSVIVAVTVVIENIDLVPEDYRPGFGLVLCWFSHRRALLLFFVVPVVTLILINIVLFSLSAMMIISTTKNAAMLHTKKSHRNFRLYLRLAILMGLTWIMGIVAAMLDVEILWHVFVVFNTLQGLFIFFAFTCTKKVLNSLLLKVKFCRLGKNKKSLNNIEVCDLGSKYQMKIKAELEERHSGDSQSSLTHTTNTDNIEDTLY